VPGPQPGALTTWLRPPTLYNRVYHKNSSKEITTKMKLKQFSLTFFFNGELYNLKTYKNFTLDDLIKFFNYKENLVVIEYNGKISHPNLWSTINLKKNDRVELLTIVGGG
jgi:sulfur carrier protein